MALIVCQAHFSQSNLKIKASQPTEGYELSARVSSSRSGYIIIIIIIN